MDETKKDSAQVLADLADFSDVAAQRLRARLAGMTDEEYFWEPVPECLTVLPVGDGFRRSGMPGVEPAPVTTLAWRIDHLLEIYAADRTATWLGVEVSPDEAQPATPGTAAAAIEALEWAQQIWRRRLTAVEEDQLSLLMGPIAGPYAESSRCAFVLHLLDEMVHHGAEIGVLRDLYRARRGPQPFVDACLRADRASVEELCAADKDIFARTRAERPDLVARAALLQRWDAVPLLAELGFDVSAGAPAAAHLAAGAGAVGALRYLIEQGADLTVTDPTFGATPLGWATYFGQSAAVELLGE